MWVVCAFAFLKSCTKTGKMVAKPNACFAQLFDLVFVAWLCLANLKKSKSRITKILSASSKSNNKLTCKVVVIDVQIGDATQTTGNNAC